MNKFLTISGVLAVSMMGAAANAAPALPQVPAPEASTNVSFGILIALGLVVAYIARKKTAKHSA